MKNKILLNFAYVSMLLGSLFLFHYNLSYFQTFTSNSLNLVEVWAEEEGYFNNFQSTNQNSNVSIPLGVIFEIIPTFKLNINNYFLAGFSILYSNKSASKVSKEFNVADHFWYTTKNLNKCKPIKV